MSTSNPEKTKPLPKTRPRKKPRWVGSLIAFVTVALLIVAGIFISLYINRQTAEVVPALRGKAVSAVYGTVKIEWAWSQTVKTENDGYIQFAPGIYSGQSSIGILVKKGQLLGTILDDATSRLIQQAKTDLQAAKDRQRIGPLALQTLHTAEDGLQRLNQLKSLNNVPEAQLEKSKNDVAQLKDAVQAEQLEINRIVENCNLALNNLLEKLRKTEIKSPLDGVLTGISFSDGERVSQNAVIFTIAMSSTYINGQVNEEDVGGLKPGMSATVRLYSFPNQEFPAKLASIVPGGDPTTQRYTVILSFDEGNMPPNLMAGMSGEMNIILGERDNSILIPASALVVNKVFIVKDNVVVPRDVQIGFRSMEKVEILSGIEEGDLVIKADQDLFRPGEKVRPIQVSTLKSPQ